MAWLEHDARTGHFCISFRLGERRIRRSLRTPNRREADAVVVVARDTIAALKRGWLTVPPGVDVGDFVLAGGKALPASPEAAPPPPPKLTLAGLFDAYFRLMPVGANEESTLRLMRTHRNHMVRHLGAALPIEALSKLKLQEYIEARSRDPGLRGRNVGAVTIQKDLVSLRIVYRWGLEAGLFAGPPFPHRGLRFAKTTEKPPFQTWAEIDRRIARGGVGEREQQDLWDCLFLQLGEVGELLGHVGIKARHPFIPPMFTTAAHTGARRSELLRAAVADLDLDAATMTLHEKKRKRGVHTTRRVPLSPVAVASLREWLKVHPGGPWLFVQSPDIPRSRVRTGTVVPLTPSEANDHFRRTVAGSRWDHLRGWHVLRHSFISNCAAKGIDQRMIDAWVGHTTEEMRRRYRHLIPNAEQAAIKTVFG